MFCNTLPISSSLARVFSAQSLTNSGVVMTVKLDSAASRRSGSIIRGQCPAAFHRKGETCGLAVAELGSHLDEEFDFFVGFKVARSQQSGCQIRLQNDQTRGD